MGGSGGYVSAAAQGGYYIQDAMRGFLSNRGSGGHTPTAAAAMPVMSCGSEGYVPAAAPADLSTLRCGSGDSVSAAAWGEQIGSGRTVSPDAASDAAVQSEYFDMVDEEFKTWERKYTSEVTEVETVSVYTVKRRFREVGASETDGNAYKPLLAGIMSPRASDRPTMEPTELSLHQHVHARGSGRARARAGRLEGGNMWEHHSTMPCGSRVNTGSVLHTGIAHRTPPAVRAHTLPSPC